MRGWAECPRCQGTGNGEGGRGCGYGAGVFGAATARASIEVIEAVAEGKPRASIQRWDLLASTEDMHETPEGEFVRFEDHERELADVRERYQAEEDVLAAAEAWQDAGPLEAKEADSDLSRAVRALREVKP